MLTNARSKTISTPDFQARMPEKDKAYSVQGPVTISVEFENEDSNDYWSS